MEGQVNQDCPAAHLSATLKPKVLLHLRNYCFPSQCLLACLLGVFLGLFFVLVWSFGFCSFGGFWVFFSLTGKKTPKEAAGKQNTPFLTEAMETFGEVFLIKTFLVLHRVHRVFPKMLAIMISVNWRLLLHSAISIPTGNDSPQCCLT